MSKRVPIEQTDLFRQFDAVSDWAWDQVAVWDWFAKKTIGSQLVRALDSVVANLVEGDARHQTSDAINFFVIARASARESRLWIEKAIKRSLVQEAEGKKQIEELESAARQLGALIRFRRETKELRTREERAEYMSEEALAF